jgi:hypothetical protein
MNHAATGRPEQAGASRETRLALVASKPAQAGLEPRHSLPMGDRPAYPLAEGQGLPRRVAVLGGTGFLGRALCERLVRAGDGGGSISIVAFCRRSKCVCSMFWTTRRWCARWVTAMRSST